MNKNNISRSIYNLYNYLLLRGSRIRVGESVGLEWGRQKHFSVVVVLIGRGGRVIKKKT